MRHPLAALTLALLASSALAGEPGNLWNTTTSMEMEGMKMPGQTRQVCVPVDAEGPEAMAGEEDDCKVTDVQRSPGRFSYRMQCPQGSGTGVMTYQGQDSYTSDVTMTMDGQTMTMSTTGTRAGSCDASKTKKQVAAMQAQANAGMAQSCASVSEQMLPAMLTSLGCDARYKQQLCDRLGTPDGFRLAAARQPMGNADVDSGTLPEAARYCGVQPEGLRERLCADADRSEDLGFLADACPAQAEPIAQRECAGRGYTTPPAEKYREFCNTYARGLMDGSAGAAAAGEPEAQPAPTATDALKEGAKRLKGLFGR